MKCITFLYIAMNATPLQHLQKLLQYHLPSNEEIKNQLSRLKYI